MSEKDIALGGAAATKFASKPGAYADGEFSYKNSDEVRKHYYQQQDQEEQRRFDPVDSVAKCTSNISSSLPIGWEVRAQTKELESKQYGVFAKPESALISKASTTDTAAVPLTEKSSVSAHVALFQVATHTLDTLASVLQQDTTGVVPADERAKFAASTKRVMDALARR